MHDRPSDMLTELVTGMGAALTDLSRVMRVAIRVIRIIIGLLGLSRL